MTDRGAVWSLALCKSIECGSAPGNHLISRIWMWKVNSWLVESGHGDEEGDEDDDDDSESIGKRLWSFLFMPNSSALSYQLKQCYLPPVSGIVAESNCCYVGIWYRRILFESHKWRSIVSSAPVFAPDYEIIIIIRQRTRTTGGEGGSGASCSADNLFSWV